MSPTTSSNQSPKNSRKKKRGSQALTNDSPSDGKQNKKKQKKKNDDSSTTTSPETNQSLPRIPTNHKSLLLDTETPFHELYPCPPTKPVPTRTNKSNTMSQAVFESLKKSAENVYKNELSLFSSLNPRTGDDNWIRGTIRKGTYKDKIAAMAVQMPTHPNHKLHILVKLMELTDSSPVRIGHMGCEALEDLFINTLLPENRKLVSLQQVDFSSFLLQPSPRTLLQYYLEHLVKSHYANFITNYLQKQLSSSQTLDADKMLALRSVGNLLRSRPEAEATLLSLLANKLGDPKRRVAQRAADVLRDVLVHHPLMSAVVTREVRQLAHRSGLPPRALYNCVTFLNQLQLDKQTTPDLAPQLVETYFSLFETAVRQGSGSCDGSSTVKSRLLSALLTGINRAHPFCDNVHNNDDNNSNAPASKLGKHVDNLFAIVHGKDAPAASVQALTLLRAILPPSQRNRFYRALYAKIATPQLLECQRAGVLTFHLLYKTMKEDDDKGRVLSFAKRLLASVASGGGRQVGTACGTLFLLNRLLKTRAGTMPSASLAVRAGLNDNLPTLGLEKRDPGSGGSLWEVTLLKHHYHPSVVAFAQSLIANDTIKYKGDPLKDFSMAHFLDRFAYRHPKKKIDQQQQHQQNIFARQPANRKMSVVNQTSFWDGNVPVEAEDEFYVQFFTNRKKRQQEVNDNKHQKNDKGEDEEFEMVEGGMVDLDNLDSDTDPEEEEFANNLAEAFMEKHGNGQAHFDNEDPDMEGWSDVDEDDSDDDDNDFADMDGLTMNDDKDNDSDDTNKYSTDNDDSSVDNDMSDNPDDIDAFMDAQGDDSSDDEKEPVFEFTGDGSDLEEEHSTPKPNKSKLKKKKSNVAYGSSSDSENDLALTFGNDSDSSDDEGSSNGNRKIGNKNQQKQKKGKVTSSFQDVSEYEDLINESYSKQQDNVKKSKTKSRHGKTKDKKKKKK
eukprot:CAMPEP_0172488012 /NCGR_PEP_ID=MMETSP1066-20121228/17358_1 /TAXON_ID=671091 /ORGANISM="Coscinodiscus wailesii, Strain CCMP2513" /LENGTH=949 /DNA_ID=CAMNT_0013254979 /DNA_START=160 /DNA_END=3009 /DNA_ORIENTATION=+